MSDPVLVIIDNALADIEQSARDFVHINVPDPDRGLALAAERSEGTLVLVPFPLPDGGQDLPDRLRQLSVPAAAILCAPAGQIDPALATANRQGFFRLLACPPDPPVLGRVLRDGRDYLTLLKMKQQLETRIDRLRTLDPATGCLREQPLRQRLAGELQRSIRYAHHLSLFLCRIDQDLGDPTGLDTPMARLADLARELLRDEVDMLCRWQPDTLLVVLPETPIWGASTVAERLSEKVAKAALPLNGQPMTVSIGITGYSPDLADWNNTLDNLIRVGANCLGQARAAGGNRILLCP